MIFVVEPEPLYFSTEGKKLVCVSELVFENNISQLGIFEIEDV